MNGRKLSGCQFSSRNVSNVGESRRPLPTTSGHSYAGRRTVAPDRTGRSRGKNRTGSNAPSCQSFDTRFESTESRQFLRETRCLSERLQLTIQNRYHPQCGYAGKPHSPFVSGTAVGAIVGKLRRPSRKADHSSPVMNPTERLTASIPLGLSSAGILSRERWLNRSCGVPSAFDGLRTVQ